MTTGEISSILASSATVGALVLAVAKFWVSRAEKRCHAQLLVTREEVLRAIGSKIERQIARKDKSTYVTLDYRMDGQDGFLRVPLLYEEIVEPLQGLRLQLVDHDKERTKYSISTIGHHAPVRLHWHYHEEAEVIHVIEGTVTDVQTGRVYHAGEIWPIAPGIRHAADFFEAYALATVRPPLPYATIAPAMLSGIQCVYDPPPPREN